MRASGRFAEVGPGRIGEVPETMQEALRPEGQDKAIRGGRLSVDSAPD